MSYCLHLTSPSQHGLSVDWPSSFKNKIIFYGERGWYVRKVLASGTIHSRLIVKSTVTATEQEKESWCSSCCCQRKTCCLLEPGLPLTVACHHHPIQLIFANQSIGLTWELIPGSKVMSPGSERPCAPPKVTQSLCSSRLSLLSLHLHAHIHYFEPFRPGYLFGNIFIRFSVLELIDLHEGKWVDHQGCQPLHGQL